MISSPYPKPIYYLYVRKSSEAEDRQVASIDAQVDELTKIAKVEGLVVAETFQESYSAKAPGRPVFNIMLEQIKKGKASGILCWKLDRLARNAIDGGQIMWMLEQSYIQHIKTFERSYYPTDNILMMSVEFGMANQYVRDLSVNVKRGLRKKVQDGIFPSVAPIGYLNTPGRENGLREIIIDPKRFHLVRKMWDMMLTGNYTPPQILEIANKEWGFTTVKHTKMGGRPIARSTLYKMFSTPFYFGSFEWPQQSGNWYTGKHTPMITVAEYERVQVLLGKHRYRISKERSFAFSGLFLCGECGCGITAEEKNQLICSVCKTKFAYQNKNSCPSCMTLIEDIPHPTILKYKYYHCTKKKPGVVCAERAMEEEIVLQQLDAYLQPIQINRKYLDWALRHLETVKEAEMIVHDQESKTQQKAVGIFAQKIDTLLDLYLNGNINETEYTQKKSDLLQQKSKLEQLVSCEGEMASKTLALTKDTFEFAHYARFWLQEAYEKSDFQAVREIIRTLGSNLQVKGKQLLFKASSPFMMMHNYMVGESDEKQRLEPEKKVDVEAQDCNFENVNPRWLPLIDTVRTFYKARDDLDAIKIYKGPP